MMFALGLAGSLHCVQMCGPLVLSFGIPMAGGNAARQWLAHALYHLGRVITYAILGAIAGWAGSAVALVGRLAGIEHTAAIVGGAFMIGAGFLLRSASRGTGLIQISAPSGFSRYAGKLLRATSPRSRFATGLAMGLLPCGLIYAALLRSVASASALPGALAMLAFGLGTAGPLFGLGVFSASLNRWLGLRGQNWAAAGVMLMGAVLIWRGLLPEATHLHHMAGMRMEMP
jgi:sulfite exporter TauE/SafE